MPEWVRLRSTILQKAARRVTCARTLVLLRATCRRWRVALHHPPASHLPPQPPFLLLPCPCPARANPKTNPKPLAHLHLLHRPRPRPSSSSSSTIPSLPCVRDALCVGSSRGWLFLLDRARPVLALLNPVTGDRLPLPDFATLPGVALRFRRRSSAGVTDTRLPRPEERGALLESLFAAAALSADPAAGGAVALVVLRSVHSACFTCRPGDWRWERSEIPFGDILDVAFCGPTRFCALLKELDLAVFDVWSGSFSTVLFNSIHSWIPTIPPCGVVSAAFLAETPGGLILATRVGQLCPGDKATPPPEEEKDRGKKTVNGIRLFSIELREVVENFRTATTREVKELEDLGDRVLFLGSRPCNSMIVAAGDVSGCEKNFVYFFDVHHEIGRNPRAVNLFGNVCKFNLADGIVKFASRFEWPASLPWWITPNLRKMP